MCVSEEHKVAFAVSRIFYHQVLLRYYSPLLYLRLQELGIEPEVYVWDWFVQCFMGIFTLDQCYVILDLLFSLQLNDNILICLSIAILDDLKPIILKVGTPKSFPETQNNFEKVMMVFTDLKNNIPLVDFPRIIQKTILIYTTTPKSIFREFEEIDSQIYDGLIEEDYCFHFDQLFLDISPRELVLFKALDLKNLLVVDVAFTTLFKKIVLQRSEDAYGDNVPS